MIRGLYVSASGMLSHSLRHEINSANLANAQTPGYKARRPILGDFQRLFISQLTAGGGSYPVGMAGTGPAVAGIINDTSQGPLRETGRELDVALQGPGFFVVETPQGIRYTRAGDWRADEAGRLVTAEGFFVLGETGYITVGTGPVTFSPDGTVFVAGELAGRLQVVDFPAPAALEPSISGTFAPSVQAGAAFPAQDTVVRQGFLEEANIDVSSSMVEMLAALRAYEAGQQAIQVQNETLRLAVNELGRL